MLGRQGVCGIALFALVMMGMPAMGQMSAIGSVQETTLGPNSFRYNLSVTNTGSVPIQTIWFGWVLPYFDLLPNAPTFNTPPSGWFGYDAPDFNPGYHSAQWYVLSPSSALAPGATLSGFSFTTPDSPTAMFGQSPFVVQTDYTYVYPTYPANTGGVQGNFTPATVTPEPASALVLAMGACGLLKRRARR